MESHTVCPSVSALLTEQHGPKVYPCSSECRCFSPFCGQVMLRCVEGPHWVLPFTTDEHLGCFHFWLLWIMLLWTRVTYESFLRCFLSCCLTSTICKSPGPSTLTPAAGCSLVLGAGLGHWGDCHRAPTPAVLSPDQLGPEQRGQNSSLQLHLRGLTGQQVARCASWRQAVPVSFIRKRRWAVTFPSGWTSSPHEGRWDPSAGSATEFVELMAKWNWGTFWPKIITNFKTVTAEPWEAGACLEQGLWTTHPLPLGTAHETGSEISDTENEDTMCKVLSVREKQITGKTGRTYNGGEQRPSWKGRELTLVTGNTSYSLGASPCHMLSFSFLKN